MFKYGVLELADVSAVVIKSEVVDHSKLSVFEKLTAIVGLNSNVAHCPRHKLYFRDNWTVLEDYQLCLCPFCWENQKHMFKEVYE